MRHLQRLPVLVGDEAGLNEEAIERPQRQGERQQRRWRGHTCGGEAGPSWVPRGPPPAPRPSPPCPARPRLPAPRCAAAPPAELYSTDCRLRSRTASGIRSRSAAAASTRRGMRDCGGRDSAGTSVRSL